MKTEFSEDDYDIRLDDKFGQLALIDLDAEAAAHEPWFNQTLTSVNDSVIRLGVIHGDFHWHKQPPTAAQVSIGTSSRCGARSTCDTGSSRFGWYPRRRSVRMSSGPGVTSHASQWPLSARRVPHWA